MDIKKHNDNKTAMCYFFNLIKFLLANMPLNRHYENV